MSTKPGTSEVDEYIASCPKEAQDNLAKMRAAIQAVAPGATERTDYFQMPGYSYPGFDYDGMFVWFSFKKPFVRLHVRPPVIEQHSTELAHYLTTKAIVSFPMDTRIPVILVKKLVKASLKIMRDKKR
jgi:uncharacterized protein YdhG (YjbR/CyaY superfamily)